MLAVTTTSCHRCFPQSASLDAYGAQFNMPPFPATASAEGGAQRVFNGAPFPASATAERPQFNGAAFPATASAEGRLIKGGPSPARGEGEEHPCKIYVPVLSREAA
jgi:hypothetical protein